jgi:hypothetical protein
MKNKKTPRAPKPAPAPKRQDQETIRQVRASINQLVVAVNGSLNHTSSILQRQMHEGFRMLEKLVRAEHR